MAKTKVNQHSTRGEASYYAGFHHGKKTASGERFNMHSLTAAHRTLPLGSKIKVTNLNNGKEVVVRVNDRGPYAKGRVLDVSLGAAKKLDMIKTGTTKVSIQILHVGNNKYVSA
jgi:rare lipoprotein A